MGVMTLSDYRSDVDLAMGDNDFGNAFLDRHINFGYLDLAGSVLFEELRANSTVNTVGSTESVSAPSGAHTIEYVRDNTNDNLLTWAPKSDILRRGVTTEGEPTYWTRHSTTLLLRPVPDDAYTLDVFYFAPPTVLSGASDVTVLPATWDQAVFYLGVSSAFMSRGEEKRAATWLATAITFIKSKITESDMMSVNHDASLPRLETRLRELQKAVG